MPRKCPFLPQNVEDLKAKIRGPKVTGDLGPGLARTTFPALMFYPSLSSPAADFRPLAPAGGAVILLVFLQTSQFFPLRQSSESGFGQAGCFFLKDFVKQTHKFYF